MKDNQAHRYELDLHENVILDEKAEECLRVWIMDDGTLSAILTIRITNDPSDWGVIMQYVLQSAVHEWRLSGRPAPQTAKEILTRFFHEMGKPLPSLDKPALAERIPNKDDQAHPYELELDEDVIRDEQAVECLRVWIMDDGTLSVILRPRITHDPSDWGIIMQYILQRVVHEWKLAGRHVPQTVTQILNRFHDELRKPLPPSDKPRQN